MIVFINVFHVEPANQQQLVDILIKVTKEIVSKAPGFVSSILHRSTDGAKVTMYARWRSLADYEAMRQDPAPRPFLEAALSIARFDPGLYEVVQEFGTPILEPTASAMSSKPS
jgi:quinol monooxygenase YgiN